MPDITVTVTTDQAQRLAVAMGDILELKDENGDPRIADLVDAKNFIILKLRQIVHNYDDKVAKAAAEAAKLPFEPS